AGILQGTLEIAGDELLPEGDRRRLPRTAADAVRNGGAVLPSVLGEDARCAAMAGHAFDLEIRPVDVHEPLEGKPASLVEAIDVLCDQEVNAARPGERGERVVGGIGAGRADHL